MSGILFFSVFPDLYNSFDTLLRKTKFGTYLTAIYSSGYESKSKLGTFFGTLGIFLFLCQFFYCSVPNFLKRGFFFGGGAIWGVSKVFQV